MNTGTPVFKIHKIQHFVTICGKSLSEISNLHERNHFSINAYVCQNKLMEHSSCMTVVAWGLNVKTYPTTQ